MAVCGRQEAFLTLFFKYISVKNNHQWLFSSSLKLPVNISLRAERIKQQNYFISWKSQEANTCTNQVFGSSSGVEMAVSRYILYVCKIKPFILISIKFGIFVFPYDI